MELLNTPREFEVAYDRPFFEDDVKFRWCSLFQETTEVFHIQRKLDKDWKWKVEPCMIK